MPPVIRTPDRKFHIDQPPAGRHDGQAARADRNRPGQVRTGRQEQAATWQERCMQGVKICLGACTALLAVSAGFRSPSERSAIWKDLSNDTANAVIGLLTFQTRVTDDLFQQANQTVSNAFARYISPESAGFSTTLDVTDRLPPDWGGMYVPGRNTIKLLPYQSSDMAKHVAAHEYCHAYTHPDFSNRFITHGSERVTGTHEDTLVFEVFTDYIACKLQNKGKENRQPACGRAKTAYQFETLQGIHLFTAVAKLENIVGEDILLRAFFSGDRDAIQTLSRASVGILPKFMYYKTLHAIVNSVEKAKPAHRDLLDNYLRGAQLLFTDIDLPTWSLVDRVHFQHSKNECARVRDLIGHERFDQAFYNFDPQLALEAFKGIRKDLIKHWRPHAWT